MTVRWPLLWSASNEQWVVGTNIRYMLPNVMMKTPVIQLHTPLKVKTDCWWKRMSKDDGKRWWWWWTTDAASEKLSNTHLHSHIHLSTLHSLTHLLLRSWTVDTGTRMEPNVFYLVAFLVLCSFSPSHFTSLHLTQPLQSMGAMRTTTTPSEFGFLKAILKWHNSWKYRDDHEEEEDDDNDVETIALTGSNRNTRKSLVSRKYHFLTSLAQLQWLRRPPTLFALSPILYRPSPPSFFLSLEALKSVSLSPLFLQCDAQILFSFSSFF